VITLSTEQIAPRLPHSNKRKTLGIITCAAAMWCELQSTYAQSWHLCVCVCVSGCEH